MGLIILIVFVAVFAVLALVLTASGTSSAQQNKQTLAVLEAALATDKTAGGEQVIDVRKSDSFSALPWMNSWLLKLELAPRLRTILSQSSLKWTVGNLLLGCLACAIVGQYLVYWRTHSLLLSLIAAIALGFVPLYLVLNARTRRFNKFEAGLPEAVDLMVNALRAGHSLASSLGLVANESPDPIGHEFRICYEEQNYGLELRLALAHMTARVPLQDLKIIVAAILIQKESGGNLAEVLDKTSHVIRERFRLKREVRTYTAQGRMTGWILSFLPLTLGLALYLINPDNMSLLWKREIGIKLLYASGGLTVLGGLVIRKIVNIDI